MENIQCKEELFHWSAILNEIKSCDGIHPKTNCSTYININKQQQNKQTVLYLSIIDDDSMSSDTTEINITETNQSSKTSPKESSTTNDSDIEIKNNENIDYSNETNYDKFTEIEWLHTNLLILKVESQHFLESTMQIRREIQNDTSSWLWNVLKTENWMNYQQCPMKF